MFKTHIFLSLISFLLFSIPQYSLLAEANGDNYSLAKYHLDTHASALPPIQDCNPNSSPFCISRDTILLAEDVCLSVDAHNFANVGGFQFSITFDTSILTFDTIEVMNAIPDLNIDDFGIDSVGLGIITAFYVPSSVVALNLADGEEVFRICFHSIAAGQGDVAFSNSPTPMLVIDSDLNELPFVAGDGFVDVMLCSNIETQLDTTICAGQSIIVGNTEYAASGNFTSTIPLGNGCDSIININLTVQDIGYTIPELLEICFGETATVTVPDGFKIGIDTSASQTVILPAGNHNLIVKNLELGCEEVQMITIVELPLPPVEISGQESFCTGEQITLTASGAETYLWSDGSTDTSLEVMTAGVYSVVGTDTSGCMNSAEFEVTELPLPNVAISGDLRFCVGLETILTATGAESYLWSDGSTGEELPVSVAGDYTVVGTSANGCTNEVTVTVEASPIPEAIIDGDFEFCSGDAATLTISPVDSGSNYSYEWSNGIPGVNFTSTVPGDYNVTITDNETGCTTIMVFELIENPLPIITFEGDPSFCEGTSTFITATGADTYLWNTGEVSATIEVTSPGTYTVEGTNANGCIGESEIEITALPLPDIQFSGVTSVCNNEPTLITASGGVSYEWSGGQSPFTAANLLTEGDYTVTVTDENGCTNVADITIEGDSTIPVFVFCPGDILVYINQGQTSVSVDWTEPLVEDNCDDFLTISSTNNSGDSFSLGTTTVTYTAVDGSGNQATCSFDVTVEESAPLSFYVDTFNYSANLDTFTIPISVIDFDDVVAFQYTITAPDLNQSHFIGIEPTGVLGGSGTLGGIVSQFIDDNTVQIIWTNEAGTGITLADSTAIFNLKMIITAPFGTCVPVEFADTPLNIEAFQMTEGSVRPTVRNGDICVKNQIDLIGKIYRTDGAPINDVFVNLVSPFINSNDTTDVAGRYFFIDQIGATDYTITPSRNIDHNEGLSVTDLVMIVQHITGVNLITDPYLLLAADINNNENVTVADILEEREVILGNIPEFPSNTSWRFIPVDFNFPQPTNPWFDVFPESVSYTEQEDDVIADFYGVKIGDLNLSLDPSYSPEEVFYLQIDNQDVEAGTTIDVPVFANGLNNIGGLQFALNYDKEALTLEKIEGATLSNRSRLSSLSYRLDESDKTLKMLWLNDGNPVADKDNRLVILKFKVRQSGSLSDYLSLQKDSAFNEASTLRALPMNVELTFERTTTAVIPVEEVSLKNLSAIPNPFGTNTNIHFYLSHSASLNLEVFDLYGRRVLSNKRHFSAGNKNWLIEGKDLPASGVYLVKIQGSNILGTIKIHKL